MKRWKHAAKGSCFLMLSLLPVGCGVLVRREVVGQPESAVTRNSTASQHSAKAPQMGHGEIELAVALAPDQADSLAEVAPFAGMSEFSVNAFVGEVLARNPSLAQMVAAWQAASARYPQVTSLDDPMFGATVGPATFGSDTVNSAYRLEISQKYPWHGKLRLRGQNSLADAAAAENNVDDMRLQLTETAKAAFYDYFLVQRAIEVNQEGLELLRKFKTNAENRVRAATGSIADLRQADVEVGRQQERGVMLERMRQVAVARINTLMHRPPDMPLPPPPKELKLEESLPDVRGLRDRAVAQRPDLQALTNRIRAEEAALGLANQEYYPDLEPFFMFDRFMGNTPESEDLAYMLGVKVNLPVRRARRDGGISEAQARVMERRAELDRRTDQVNLEVQQTYAEAQESERLVHLYRDTILPDAQKNVEASEREYGAGRVPFLTLIEAQRNAVNLRDRYYEVTADYFRRRATLERVIGGPVAP